MSLVSRITPGSPRPLSLSSSATSALAAGLLRILPPRMGGPSLPARRRSAAGLALGGIDEVKGLNDLLDPPDNAFLAFSLPCSLRNRMGQASNLWQDLANLFRSASAWPWPQATS